ncbi:Chitinase A1 [Psilocybe cubensis]|uniref:Chitinase A1 n=1 Tax=Psilocybe cubensis TaxID=181762 RepID=A0ACB8GPP9_PSICU|nr:Chitinase A1 [Psilocybe cubensis]KAH9477623.1 Chitinase A1 [Psilocybe cubensis]
MFCDKCSPSLLAGLAALFSNVLAAPHCNLVPPTRPSLTAQTGSSGSIADGMDVVATGWYPGWLGSQLPPNEISWTKYSALTFAFATTTPDPSVIALDDESAALLPTFVNEAHNNCVDALLSIGGWTGSIYYSTAVGSADNRTTFVKAILDLVNTYALDGIDFDWEYPSRQGIGCNTISDDDSANFLSFLEELREDPVGADLTLTAAVGLTPFAGPGGIPLSDVSAFADVLDHIAIMNYDVWGAWSTDVGPNAPLNDSCAAVQAGSATSAVKAWTDAGFPASKANISLISNVEALSNSCELFHAKIVLGVAAYGHSFHVATNDALDNAGNLALYPPFDKSQQPLGDSDIPGAPPSEDECGNPVGVSGTFNFNGMVAAGFLDTNGNAAAGIDYRFDNCSQTPFVYDPNNQTMISYDDQTSFAAKGRFIDENGLAGFAIWHVAGDYNDTLLNAISDALDLEQVCS